MNPLYEKYFFGELTDSEESTLEEILAQSEAAAWEFGQAAEEVYSRYGLPEPDLPGQGEGGKKGTNPWTYLPPLMGLLLLGTYWWWKAHQVVVPEPVIKVLKESLPKPVRKVIHEAPPVVRKVMVVPTKALEIPPGGTVDKVSGNNLKVVVKRETAGPVVVRVINSLGVEIRRLFGGTLQAGSWSFEWDGRSGDGKLVDPGKYRIEVQTEGSEQSKEVNIR